MVRFITQLFYRLSRANRIVKNTQASSLLPGDFKFPKKRWPHFLFRQNNRNVEAARIIFKGFNYAKFYEANSAITAFQFGGESTPKAVLYSYISEKNAVNTLRTSFDHYCAQYPKSLFLERIQHYIQSLEATLQSQKQHYRTALYLDDGFRSVLNEMEQSCHALLSSFDDQSIKAIPLKLKSLTKTIHRLQPEIAAFPHYTMWFKKLFSFHYLLKSFIQGEPLCSCKEFKQALKPWFSHCIASDLFIEQCVRQFYTHFLVPHIKSASDYRLAMIHELNANWASTLTQRLLSPHEANGVNPMIDLIPSHKPPEIVFTAKPFFGAPPKKPMLHSSLAMNNENLSAALVR